MLQQKTAIDIHNRNDQSTEYISRKLLCGLFSVIILVSIGCRTVPDAEEIDPNLSPDELFQLAQEAFADEDNYKAAIVYYQTFLERFPDDITRAVEAEYEIAFILYKQKKYEESKQHFEELLQRYEQEGSEVLPEWPRILSEKVLRKIEEKTQRRFSRRSRNESEEDEGSATDGEETADDAPEEPRGETEPPEEN